MRNIKKIVLLLSTLRVIKLTSTEIVLNSTWWTKPISFMYPLSDNVSEICKNDTMEYLLNIKNESPWALKMMDASGRLQSGLLSSNIRALGSFDQCLSIENPSQKFVGKYCLIRLNFGTHRNSAIREMFYYYVNELHSDRTLKYFPTFLTGKWALCVPSSCTVADVHILGTSILTRATKNLNLNSSILLNDCITASSARPYKISEYLALTVFGITLLMIIASTLICYFLEKGERKSVFSKLIYSFSLINNWNQWLELTSSRSLKFLEGIRALSAVHIVLIHEKFRIFAIPYLNLEKLIQDNYNYTFTPLWFTGTSVDAFLLLSGLLRSYNLINSYDQGHFEIIKPIVRRYLRLTPNYMFVVIFYAAIYDRIDNGPEWNYSVKIHAEDCRIYWWKNLLYINNYSMNQCVSPSWFLAMEMQMFIISPLMIYPLWKWKDLGKSILVFTLIISCLAPIIQLYFLNFPIFQIFNTGPDALYYSFNAKFYTQTHTRMSPYFIGIFMGIVLRRNKIMRISKWLQRIGWLTCFFILIAYSYGQITLAEESQTFEEKLRIAMHYSLGRLACSVAIAWIIYICILEKDGLVTRFLSCNILLYLGKVSYCLYLIHFAVLFYSIGITQTPELAHPFIVIRSIIGDFGFILFFALLLYVLVESPFFNVTELLLGNKRAVKNKDTDEGRLKV